MNVQYVVAPYEADAQLAWLEREGVVDGIVTEDSDLLVFGCKLVIFKVDNNGDGTAVSRSSFASPLLKETSLIGWSDREFRQMAILSGCDYLESVKGVGIKTAYKLMKKYKTVDKVGPNFHPTLTPTLNATPAGCAIPPSRRVAESS